MANIVKDYLNLKNPSRWPILTQIPLLQPNLLGVDSFSHSLLDPWSWSCHTQVAWVRVDTQTILTIHNNVITRNPRISLSRPGENKWWESKLRESFFICLALRYLHMNSVQENDRGWYMCQVKQSKYSVTEQIVAKNDTFSEKFNFYSSYR